MIIRIFRVTVFEDQTDAFRRFLEETALPLLHDQPGIISVTPGLPRPESPTEFCIVVVLDSVASLAGITCDEWLRPQVMPDLDGMVHSRHLHQFDLLEIDASA